jgi:hypothetical protein
MSISRRRPDKTRAALASTYMDETVRSPLTRARSAAGRKADKPRSSAIDPDLLSAEIGLLLDHISGLPGRSLSSAPNARLPVGCDTYAQALARFFAIDDEVRKGEVPSPADLQFLLEMRDYLNGQASPATGATIAFSTLVIRKTPEAPNVKADAERAYPEWFPMARALRQTMAGLQIAALLITLVVASLGAYAYFGSSFLNNLAALTTQHKSLGADIARVEEKEANHLDGGVMRYCEGITLVPDPADPTNKLERFNTPTQARLCDDHKDVLRKFELAYASLARFHFPRDDRQLVAMLEALRGYLLPVLMGLLGSIAYVLRRYLRAIGERMLNPRDLREYIVRIVLGTLCGVVIGFFTSSSGGDTVQNGNALIIPVSLTAPALAFLAGYGVEVVFRMLDGVSEQFFAVRK